MESKAHCSHHEHQVKSKKWFQRPLFLLGGVCVGLTAASYFLETLGPFRHAFYRYLQMLGIPLAAGFVVGGIIDYYLPAAYVSKLLAQPKKRTVMFAVGLGFFMSACSHGVLALAMELHKKGASGPAVVAFLLASPWASLPITFLLIGFFGMKAFWLIGLALLIAIVTGFLFQGLDALGWIEHNRHTVPHDTGFSVRRDLKKRFKAYAWTPGNLWRDFKGILRGARSLVDMVLVWVLLGALLASLASAYVPPDLFDRFLGPSLSGLMLTMVLAIIVEVCSEGSSPVAFEIYRNTGAFGNAFAFLMGGVITDVTELSLIWANLGKRTALWLLAAGIPQILFFGWLLNQR